MKSASVALFLLLAFLFGCTKTEIQPSNAESAGEKIQRTPTPNQNAQKNPNEGKPKELIELENLKTKPKPGIVGIWLPQIRDENTGKVLETQPWVTIEFKKDGNFLITGWGPRGKITSSGKYKLEGSKLTLITEVIEGKPAPKEEQKPKIGKLKKDGITLVDDIGVEWIKKK